MQDDVCVIDNVTLLEEEIVAVINNLDSNKAQGPDGIPVRLLKETAMHVAPSLPVLFNKSLNIGVLPDEWKLANVVPVHKHGEKSYVEHYRPISLLSIISKALVLQTLPPLLMIQKSLKQPTHILMHLLYKQISPTSKKDPKMSS